MRRSAVKWVAALAVVPVLAAVALGWSLAAHGVPDNGSHELVQLTTVRASSSDQLPVARAPASAQATWCGTPAAADLTPNTIAGHPVHWVYAIPSDGADRFSAVASTIQTDAEEIDAWWRREDPARTPRNDLAPFPCGQQLDLTNLRIPLSGAELTEPDGRFGTIFDALTESEFDSPFTKYVVYYDGPTNDEDLCGQGGSDRSGIGLAVVYTQACAGVSTAGVVAHELLHSFGAVPDEAPNECSAPNDAHTCDTPTDLMYPFADLLPLSAKFLDPGRNDYYGHSGRFEDMQDVPWLVQLDRQQPLTVTITGPGAIRADVPGLQCSQTCTTTWNAGTELELSATPGAGARLVRWSGACAGSGPCNVTTSPSARVSAVFAPAVFRLNLSVSGRGSVRSSRSGITCRPRCSASFPSHVPVRLTATPARGWKFRSWAGACRGGSRSCTVPMTAATNARAIFVRA